MNDLKRSKIALNQNIDKTCSTMSILIIGATRGLGASLTRQYAQQGKTVYGTTRSSQGPASPDFPEGLKWLTSVDLMQQEAGDTIASQLRGAGLLDTVVKKLARSASSPVSGDCL